MSKGVTTSLRSPRRRCYRTSGHWRSRSKLPRLPKAVPPRGRRRAALLAASPTGRCPRRHRRSLLHVVDHPNRSQRRRCLLLAVHPRLGARAGSATRRGGRSLKRVPARWEILMSWTGLGAIPYSAVAFDATTAYPGSVVAVPVVGAALMSNRSSSARVTRTGLHKDQSVESITQTRRSAT